MEQNIKLLKKLIFCVLAHLVVSSVTIMLWVVNVVFFLKEYSAISNVIDPFLHNNLPVPVYPYT